jgi:hypothetical protein
MLALVMRLMADHQGKYVGRHMLHVLEASRSQGQLLGNSTPAWQDRL